MAIIQFSGVKMRHPLFFAFRKIGETTKDEDDKIYNKVKKRFHSCDALHTESEDGNMWPC
jgi:hypothetical protein